MAAIAGLAALLWALQVGWRWHQYRRWAAFHAQIMADRMAGIEAGGANLASRRRQLQSIRESRKATLDGRLPGLNGDLRETVKRYDGYIASDEEFVAQMEEAMRNTRADAAYHARLCLKYRDAAARPWLRVAPDPPVPQSVTDIEAYLTPMDESVIARLKPTAPPPSQPRLESLE